MFGIAYDVGKQILHSNKTINDITSNPIQIMKNSFNDMRMISEIKAKDMPTDNKYLERAGITAKKNEAGETQYFNSKNEKLNINKDGYYNNLTLKNRFKMSYLNKDGSYRTGKIAGQIAGLYALDRGISYLSD